MVTHCRSWLMSAVIPPDHLFPVTLTFALLLETQIAGVGSLLLECARRQLSENASRDMMGPDCFTARHSREHLEKRPDGGHPAHA